MIFKATFFYKKNFIQQFKIVRAKKREKVEKGDFRTKPIPQRKTLAASNKSLPSQVKLGDMLHTCHHLWLSLVPMAALHTIPKLFTKKSCFVAQIISSPSSPPIHYQKKENSESTLARISLGMLMHLAMLVETTPLL